MTLYTDARHLPEPDEADTAEGEQMTMFMLDIIYAALWGDDAKIPPPIPLCMNESCQQPIKTELRGDEIHWCCTNPSCNAKHKDGVITHWKGTSYDIPELAS